MTTLTYATDIRQGDRFEYGAEIFTAYADARALGGDVEILISGTHSLLFDHNDQVRSVR